MIEGLLVLIEGLLVLAAVLVGYFLKGLSKEVIRDNIKLAHDQQVRVIANMKGLEVPTGQIKHKTLEDVKKLSMTQKEKEGLEAMKETLDATPELRVHRELVARLKKENKEKGIYE